jgi:uncharacterized NAD(P)/FAD-binding protein YdhS
METSTLTDQVTPAAPESSSAPESPVVPASGPAVVAIIGAGFSGSLLALHLLAAGSPGPKIFLIERRGGFGKGTAFATGNPAHLLNVRAANMGAFPDQPDHFLSWLRRQPGREAAGPASFVDRGTYGVYLQQMMTAAACGPQAAGRLVLVPDEATALRRRPDGRLGLRLAMGREIAADSVVLALGNFAPELPDSADPALAGSPCWLGDPWSAAGLNRIGTLDSVLLIGTGLTMVDVALALDGRGHQGAVLALSRRGLLPRRHRPEALHPLPKPLSVAGPLSQALRQVRAAVRQAAESGLPWQTVIDALRGQTTGFWQGLPPDAKERFLRHLRPWWDVHRHRLAPMVADRLDRLTGSGRLAVAGGRVRALVPVRTQDASGRDTGPAVQVTWTPRRGGPEMTRLVRHVVNCAGPGCDLARSGGELVQGLLAGGLARQDPRLLGLDVDIHGRLLGGADGQNAPGQGLYAIGPVTRGTFWEITAVPDIRVQARNLAATVLTDLAARPNRTARPIADSS